MLLSFTELLIHDVLLFVSIYWKSYCIGQIKPNHTVCTLLRQQKKVQNVEINEKYGHYMEQRSLIIHNWSTLWGHLKYIKCLI